MTKITTSTDVSQVTESLGRIETRLEELTTKNDTQRVINSVEYLVQEIQETREEIIKLSHLYYKLKADIEQMGVEVHND